MVGGDESLNPGRGTSGCTRVGFTPNLVGVDTARALGKVASSGLTKSTLGHASGLSDVEFCLTIRYIAT